MSRGMRRHRGGRAAHGAVDERPRRGAVAEAHAGGHGLRASADDRHGDAHARRRAAIRTVRMRRPFTNGVTSRIERPVTVTRAIREAQRVATATRAVRAGALAITPATAPAGAAAAPGARAAGPTRPPRGPGGGGAAGGGG